MQLKLIVITYLLLIGTNSINAQFRNELCINTSINYNINKYGLTSDYFYQNATGNKLDTRNNINVGLLVSYTRYLSKKFGVEFGLGYTPNRKYPILPYSQHQTLIPTEFDSNGTYTNRLVKDTIYTTSLYNFNLGIKYALINATKFQLAVALGLGAYGSTKKFESYEGNLWINVLDTVKSTPDNLFYRSYWNIFKFNTNPTNTSFIQNIPFYTALNFKYNISNKSALKLNCTYVQNLSRSIGIGRVVLNTRKAYGNNSAPNFASPDLNSISHLNFTLTNLSLGFAYSYNF